ncbi:hypothetical protein LWC35_17450 [Pseudonocardia kujensis]|uniref:hypothetical protein n=1 Tax=Pseudonocardia kujensis TaxID=1128675 RepID=UPI001E65BD32|nr:hypothetical protein [Pseudonocardia kujensis]MCE0764681.1 hypothetical protein [Pseudonocardia kujensis]
MDAGTGVRRALPYAPGEWARLVSSVVAGLATVAGSNRPSPLPPGLVLECGHHLVVALDPVCRTACRTEQHLSPHLVYVTVDPGDVTVLGAAARELGTRLLPPAPGGAAGPWWGPESPVPESPVLDPPATGTAEAPAVLVPDMTLVHVLLDTDHGTDTDVLHRWGADGAVLGTPPPEALAAHHRVAARVLTLWRAGLAEPHSAE